MIQKIKLQYLSKGLNIRVQRLVHKSEKLGLQISDDEILVEDSIILLQDFMSSLKTSEKTKIQAQMLLNEINTNGLPKKKSMKYPKPLSKKMPQKWYKTFVNQGTEICQTFYAPVQSLVKNFILSSVQVLESLYFKFIALIVAITVQMHHSANWFYRISPEENPSWLAALGYAFMVDLFILVVTLEGKLSIAKVFAVLTFLANILYFQFWVNFDDSVQAYTNAVSSILVSGIMAYIIYAYTELFVKHNQ